LTLLCAGAALGDLQPDDTVFQAVLERDCRVLTHVVERALSILRARGVLTRDGRDYFVAERMPEYPPSGGHGAP
jgi:hypothetical protein